MNHRASLILVLALAFTSVIASGCVTSQSSPGDADEPPQNESASAMDDEVRSWFEPAEPMKIVGPIHFVGTRGLGTYLITTAQGHILLYGGMPKTAPMIESNIRKLGFDPADIKLMLACHAHIDHVGTHAYFRELSGATVAMMAQEVELVQSGGTADFQYGNDPAFHFQPVKVDRVLRDGESVTLGDVTLTAHLTPGHTKGGTTWTMNAREGGKVYSVVFPDGTSVNSGYRLARFPSYPGIADDFRRSLHVHETLKPDIWLHSHTSFFGFAEKRERAKREGLQAWVDPEGYREFVKARREAVEKRIDADMNGPSIAGVPWSLASFTSDDGERLTADHETQATVEFHDDGRAALQLAINRGSSEWKLGGSNEIEFGVMALTRAASPPNPLRDRFTQDWMSIRKFELRDGRLFLSLADGSGSYAFDRTASPSK